ncbi:MAG: LysR family transcriptional regulator [Segniliparus sp.]|uniref:LysR family transcriptional regulator n=1 Tax=Segniliparus sp. TaxID=2804064 RepID=UPI003F3289E4
MDISLRVLKYAVTVAEQGSFTAAAEVLYVSQPSLSRQVRQLEEDLGVVLFERNRRGIEPTESGKEFLDTAKGILEGMEDAVNKVKMAEAAGQQVLRVGVNGPSTGRLTARLRARFAKLCPDVEIQPKAVDWGGEAAALREGLVDAAFLWLPADVEGLATTVVDMTHRSVALPIDHPLCAKPYVVLQDLRDEPRIWLSRKSRKWVDWWAAYAHGDKPAPAWGPEADSIDEMLEYTGAGRGVFFMPSTIADLCVREDIRWRPLDGEECTSLAVGYVKASADPHVAAFAKACVAANRSSKFQFEENMGSPKRLTAAKSISRPA